MAKAVFRPAELINVPETVMISSPVLFQDSAGISLVLEEEGIQERPVVEEYTGPTADDLRREAELFRQQWAIEKEAMIEAAKTEANEIIQTADLSAFQDKQRGDDEAKAVIAAAKEEAEKLITDARRQARELEAQIKATLDEERKTTLEESRETGRLEGYTAGKVEVDRLVERTQLVLERAQNKRGEILTETEQQIIDLVLLITRKVVKVIAENQREVIISNVIQALRKVRDRGNIIIRVNIADLKLTTEHTKEFIQMLEGVKSIQVVEDSSVDSGGCIIETDFGEIDARISSQLAELETRILEISPIKSKIKSGKAQ